MKIANSKSFYFSEGKHQDNGHFVDPHDRLFKLGSNVGVVGCHALSNMMNRISFVVYPRYTWRSNCCGVKIGTDFPLVKAGLVLA